MKKTNHYFPAFPVITTVDTCTSGSWASTPGMSMRDWFAGMAITCWLGSRESDVLLAKCGDDAYEAAEMMANAAYMLAEAMVRRGSELEGHMVSKCRKCERSFNWDKGEGYAKMNDGTYLCSMACEMREARDETATLARLARCYLNAIDLDCDNGDERRDLEDAVYKAIGSA